MTADRHPRVDSRSNDLRSGDRESSANRHPRDLQTVVVTAGTVIAGCGALVLLGFEVLEGDSSVLDVLLWCALVVLLFGAAAHQWWFADRAADRSRDITEGVTDADVETLARESIGDVDLVRRLRVAFPGLNLRDAYELVQDRKRRHPSESA
ncbi:hypothetical protein NCCP2495_30470 [Dietzia sp. NCCP-2495]|uniref:hypothetical protein n=1 Tax=Dietzia sp. NCCP-2495 TaxID=2934675 RepID=UPI0022318A06|nr:hypothetical protein [Dietzia sp. NCCP-2495]GLB65167.1 hypothetical protein NCCP2495_30470 [Dietzia sp. NCCP-2495]